MAVVAVIGYVFLTQQKSVANQANALATAVASFVANPTEPPTFPEITPPPVQEATASIGEAVPLQATSSGASLGSITVLAFKKYTSLDYAAPDTGDIYVEVEVKYVAESGFDYNPLDFVVHTANGSQYTATFYPVLTPSLDSGVLAAGRQRTGWISFEVPRSASHLSVDYQNSDGTVVFTVPLY